MSRDDWHRPASRWRRWFGSFQIYYEPPLWLEDLWFEWKHIRRGWRKAREFRKTGPGSLAPYCKHGVPGGLHCTHCGDDPDHLPKDKQVRITWAELSRTKEREPA